jgi:hypothetical protein
VNHEGVCDVKKVPEILDRITDVVLAYQPKDKASRKHISAGKKAAQ